ncbi:hypothetical protein [Roseateles sp.]|jgi:hypothetical protein|uniref:hypothetical protein n=1 Tax=Roseateles sp. TaxID=1971397 RepID=UPI0037CC8E8A
MPSLDDAYTRLERADEHLSQVRALALQICNAQAEATKVRQEPGQTIQPGEIGQIFEVESASTPIVGRLAILVGDSVNNLRSCLDYLVGELAELDSGSRKPRTQFPVETSPAAFRGQRKRFLNGVGDTHAAYIETLQPYNGTVWTAKLSSMSNWDKHNKLVLVAHDYLVSASVTQGEPSPSGEVAIQLQFAIQPSLRIQLENGLQLLDSLQEIRDGVASTLDHFSSAFRAP